MQAPLSRRSFLCAAAAAGATGCKVPRASFDDVPGSKPWHTANSANPTAARQLQDLLETLDTTALVVAHRGRLIHQHGDTQKLSYLASARKSLISMLYGPAIERGEINADATLESIGFDDLGGLLPIECRATIRNLLTARSGVYHPAANLGDASDRAPPRGSVEPGQYFLYNNWDFNALGSIYEKLTGRGVYSAFSADIARPIGCEDWDEKLHATMIRNDTGASKYPAHHFVLSTRDMARIGQLMLQRGQWGSAQVIPQRWTSRTTSLVTPATEVARTSPFVDGLGYGYLWWIFDPAGPWPRAMHGGYTASGAMGQFITVVPTLELVIAHKTMAPGQLNVPPERYFGAVVPAALALVG